MNYKASQYETRKWERIFDAIDTRVLKISEAGGISSASIEDFAQKSVALKTWGFLCEGVFIHKEHKHRILEFTRAGEVPRLLDISRRFPAKISSIAQTGLTIEFTSSKDFYLPIDSNVMFALPTLDYELHLISAKVFFTRLTARNRLLYGFVFTQSLDDVLRKAA